MKLKHSVTYLPCFYRRASLEVLVRRRCFFAYHTASVVSYRKTPFSADVYFRLPRANKQDRTTGNVPNGSLYQSRYEVRNLSYESSLPSKLQRPHPASSQTSFLEPILAYRPMFCGIMPLHPPLLSLCRLMPLVHESLSSSERVRGYCDQFIYIELSKAPSLRRSKQNNQGQREQEDKKIWPPD